MTGDHGPIDGWGVSSVEAIQGAERMAADVRAASDSAVADHQSDHERSLTVIDTTREIEAYQAGVNDGRRQAAAAIRTRAASYVGEQFRHFEMAARIADGEQVPATRQDGAPPPAGVSGELRNKLVDPLDGWDECTVPGCPSWDDDADPAAVNEFEDSDGWAHGVRHVHLVDHYLVPTGSNPTTNGARP